MKREQHIKFCKACDNQKYDPKKGLICKLTDDIADFETHCESFLGDIELTKEPEPIPNVPLKKSLSHFFSLFIPTDKFFITPVVVDASISLFGFMIILGVHFLNPAVENIVWWGANVKSLTLDGQYWRLLSSCFVHIGVIHLICNMCAMLYIGSILEPLIGKGKMGVAFVLCGVGGSVASLYWHENIISAGASGAIFGVYGVLIVLACTNALEKKLDKTMISSLVAFVAYNLIYGMKNGIDNASHIGGLCVGLLYGLSIYPSVKCTSKRLFVELSYYVSPAIIIVLLSVVFTNIPTTIVKYEKLMTEFVVVEQEAIKVYSLPENTSDERYIRHLNKGINSWEKCKGIVEQADSLQDLSDDFYQRLDLLDRYCDYRIKTYQLHKKTILETTYRYQNQIESYSSAIENIISKLQGVDINDDLLFADETILQNNYSFLDKSSIDYPKLQSQLVVVDGRVFDGTLADIPPAKIESMTFLKANAASSIYGERGKNGAVLINIKKE